MSEVLEITRKFTLLGKMRHYLFECPTFWRRKPAFQCPVCEATYRCYWDGNDVGGKINVCKKCTHAYCVYTLAQFLESVKIEDKE
jgi:hypothetical protein